MPPQGQIRLTVVLDGATGLVKVEGPLEALNRFACVSLLECGKHEVHKWYDEREARVQKPDEHAVRQFGQRIS